LRLYLIDRNRSNFSLIVNISTYPFKLPHVSSFSFNQYRFASFSDDDSKVTVKHYLRVSTNRQTDRQTDTERYHTISFN